jgi:hypothetical protein
MNFSHEYEVTGALVQEAEGCFSIGSGSTCPALLHVQDYSSRALLSANQLECYLRSK